eukprot:scaffold248438_cov104-Cyclotella_meneghiniana.AAC.5
MALGCKLTTVRRRIRHVRVGDLGISSRSTKHTDIKVNADPDEPRSPSPNIILIVDRFSGNMVIKSIKIQQSTVNFSC